jgi:putative pyruvate formate lyase activating enzyme
MIPQMLRIINALHKIGRKPVIVYNTNAYDKVEVLKQLEDLIDVYLPDLKYSQVKLAEEFSDSSDYVDVANRATREMFRQKGTPLHLDESGRALSGLIIRHLVLPGYIENSKGVLRNIAENLSPRIHISLMSQYYPMDSVIAHPNLNRFVRVDEYNEIVHEMENLGMENGWVQDLESSRLYLPDFRLNKPFREELNSKLETA